MKVKELTDWLDGRYPADMAEHWDNVGLLVGDDEAEVHHVLLALDLTEKTLDEAISAGADMIITHHPMIFEGQKKINNHGEIERVITKGTHDPIVSEEDFDKVMDTNLKGTFHTIRAALRQMIRQRSGRIINMASVVGVSGNAGQANYAASKAGVIGLTKTAAREVASRGITVNAIAPGFIETEMTDVLPEDVKENLLASIPLKRMGQTKDIAETVAFLASDKAAYITGQTISVDGGMGM